MISRDVINLTQPTKGKRLMMTTNLEQQKHSLNFDIHRSIRYNSKRTAFFQKWDLIVNFFNLLLGSSTMASILMGYPNGAIVAAFIVTVLSLFALLIGFSAKANRHQNLVFAFGRLRENLNSQPLTLELLNKINEEMHQLDDEEGEPHKWLERISYNETVIALGYNENELLKVKWYQRLFAQYL